MNEKNDIYLSYLLHDYGDGQRTFRGQNDNNYLHHFSFCHEDLGSSLIKYLVV